APADDPQRGPRSPRHRPWSANGQGTQTFEWVPLATSLQWAGFQRLVELLRARHNDLLVVVGPFNEHLIAVDNRPAYRRIRDGVIAWLEQQQVPYVVPDVLPSELYADASHPLTQGYALLAARIYQSKEFERWCQQPSHETPSGPRVALNSQRLACRVLEGKTQTANEAPNLDFMTGSSEIQGLSTSRFVTMRPSRSTPLRPSRSIPRLRTKVSN
ncbi:MAG: hypothetical protein KGS61_04565, partial [Verrucomicrobia bacterium]|nr:hypothetical protein [Verrucomicrobiota bacterium]